MRNEEYAIKIDGLTKRFGETLALDGLSLTVERGSVFGFLGPNGAGKTTTQRLLVGLAAPTSGTARILGHDIVGDIAGVHRSIGWLPDVPSFYPWMTAPEYLRFVGDIFGMSSGEIRRKTDELLKTAGLEDVKTRIGGYSRGMKQRLGVAQALMNEPEVILMDEPTSALDPIGRKEVLDLIARLSAKHTIFFSTHILNDVERVCDTVAILNKGRLMTEESLESLKGRYARSSFSVELAADAAPLLEQLRTAPWVVSTTPGEFGALTVVTKDVASGETELPRLISELGLPLKGFRAEEPSLEDIFVKMMEEAS